MISFSIIIPLYNKERTIRNTIESVLKQSYSYFEIIVIDDGSTDGSVEIVKSYTDERIHLFRKENGGPGSARNYGVRKAQNDWIIWLDADDMMQPKALASFVYAIERNPHVDMVVGNFQIEEGKAIRLYQENCKPRLVNNAFKAWFMKKIMPCAGAYTCKKDVILKHPYNEFLKRYEDAEVLFRLFQEIHIYLTDFVVMRYRRDFSKESHARNNIAQDFLGHLKFDRKKSLWERICLYELYVEAKNNYPNEVNTFYPDMNRYFLLKVAYHLAFWYRAILRKR